MTVRTMDNPDGPSHTYSVARRGAQGYPEQNPYVTPTPLFRCQALLETVAGNPYFFHLVWKW